MNTTRLALRLLGREWRSSELRVLALALIIAVASLSSVNFFTNRVHQVLEGQASNLLGGDLLLLADHPIKKGYSFIFFFMIHVKMYVIVNVNT